MLVVHWLRFIVVNSGSGVGQLLNGYSFLELVNRIIQWKTLNVPLQGEFMTYNIATGCKGFSRLRSEIRFNRPYYYQDILDQSSN